MQNGIQKFSFALFLALVFSLGFMWPSLDVRVIELTPTDLLFPLVLIASIAAVVTGGLRPTWHPVYGAILIYVGAMSVSAAFSTNRYQSFIQLVGVIYLALLAVVTALVVTDLEKLRLAVMAWIAGAVIPILLGLGAAVMFYVAPGDTTMERFLQRSGAVPFIGLPRIGSTFVSASMFCNYLTATAALLLVSNRMRWLSERFVWILVTVVVCAAALTVSIALGGLALLFGLWLWYVRSRPIESRIALSLGVAVAIAFLLIAPFDLSSLGSPSSRALVWSESLQTFLAAPITGNGVGTGIAKVAYHGSDGTWSILLEAHNTFLNVAAQAGVIGLGALIVLIIAVLRSAFRKLGGSEIDPIRLGLGITFIAAFVYDGLTGSFEEARHLWVLMGMIVAAERISTQNATARQP